MFSEFYKSVDNKVYESLALEYLVNDTLRDNLRGKEKSKQITAMDMESSAKISFIPSMFYTFMYNSDIINKTGNLKYKDVIPLILCMSNDGQYVTGINFNLLPNDIRALLLDNFYNCYRDFYENDVSKAVEKNQLAINQKFAHILIDENTRARFLEFLDNNLKLPISKTYRRYKIASIYNPRMIEYDAWKYIPFLSFKDAIRGAGLASIQASIIADK